MLGTAALTQRSAAQVLPLEKFVIHLWVDPRFGDDALASGSAALNPNGASTFLFCTPTPPGSPPRPNGVGHSTGAVLLHAPHPFKTIGAAVDYIVATGPGPANPLPNTDLVTWEHAIIHLMPGIYGQGGASTFGQPANGEVFPIHLPPNVSVQGTSALNTVLEIDLNNAPAFEFGVNHTFSSGRMLPINGVNTFLDGVTIAGNADVDANLINDKRQYCGIWVAGDVASRPTITNCVFRELWVGMGIGASATAGVADHDGLTLANATFAWSRICLWNGLDIAPPAVAVGRSRINVLNCIFDATPPPSTQCSTSASKFRGGSSAFEGMSVEDMLVLVPGAGAAQDTNAFELGKHSQNSQILALLPATSARTGNPPGNPRVDISPITGALGLNPPQNFRGILFVRDLLCHPVFAAPNFDGSLHDFRLAPNAGLAGQGEPQAPDRNLLNPLVDAGFSDAGFAGSGSITFVNGNALTAPPGTLALGPDQENWVFHTWEFDLEGYGNPRITDHPSYSNPQFGAAPGDPIDIGADELGELIVAGYMTNTTELRREGSLVANHRSWYLGPISDPASPPPGVSAPLYRILPNLNATAWPVSTYPSVATWHTAQDRGFGAFLPTPMPPTSAPPISVIYPATMADVTPHLLDDVHPWWSVAWSIGSPVGVAPALTLWEECLGAIYNAALYLPSTVGRINPPAAAQGTTSSFVWLDGRAFFGASSPATFFTFASTWSSLGTIFGFDPFCRGRDSSFVVTEILHPSTVPSGGGVPSTLRFTVELLSSDKLFAMPTNLQSFTIWSDGGAQ